MAELSACSSGKTMQQLFDWLLMGTYIEWDAYLALTHPDTKQQKAGRRAGKENQISSRELQYQVEEPWSSNITVPLLLLSQCHYNSSF
mmetsp:Transcript_6024/g.13982  ORF Transcript_6024/g.13982 Transcript_6024/m.13982 type:complete len:88 (+) Transcript_6024:305-568(+)